MKKKTSNGKNLVLITVDCLRADHIHCMGYTKNITPTIDYLAKNGIIFTNAIANAPSTSYSIPSFLTSNLPPVEENPKETIAGILKKHGYSTATFNPNPIFSTIGGGRSSTKGFDIYDVMLSNKKRYCLFFEIFLSTTVKSFRNYFIKKGISHKKIYSLCDILLKLISNLLFTKHYLYVPTAEEINNKAVIWIKNQKGKFFVWLHYMDAHEPYNLEDYEEKKELPYLVAKYRYLPNLLTKQERQKLTALYDLEIGYIDKAINNLLKELIDLNYFENSIIIVSADHGDAFGEHGTFGHGGKYSPQLYDEVLHVPLIIYGLEKKGIKIDRQVQLLDLGPTICKLLKISTPHNFLGRNLFNLSNRGIIANCRSCIAYRTDKYKLIINKSEGLGNELYDLKKDPKETINIYDQDKEITKKLETEMITLLLQYKKKEKILNVGNLLETNSEILYDKKK
ncbi:MAG: sulfatase [Candidatus Hodarchaeota archaeon]